MPETLDDFLMTRPPTAERPLLGQTLLVVEDSRFACEALRLICQRSGARIRRADSLASASRHLCTYRPGIVVVDVGLPDGSGLDLIRTLANTDPRIPLIMAMSGDDTIGARDNRRARARCWCGCVPGQADHLEFSLSIGDPGQFADGSAPNGPEAG